MKRKQIKRKKIDLILPWVDGSDPAWLEEKAQVTGEKPQGDGRNFRYRDWDNLQYVFRGIEKNLPWIHKVHFVTWGHLPKWLNTDCPKLHVVRHEDYIPEKYLPTFNSIPIEMNMHRIPGLTEQFIFTNDDIFFLKPFKPEDFFRDGLPVDSLQQKLHVFTKDNIAEIIGNDLIEINDHFDKYKQFRKNKSKWINPVYGTRNLMNLYLMPFRYFTGFTSYHLTTNFLKSTLEEVWSECDEILDKSCAHQIRSKEDVNQYLFRYWQLVTGTFYPGNTKFGKNYHIGEGNDNQGIKEAIAQGKQRMIGIGDNAIAGKHFEENKNYIKGVLQEAFPEKSCFEK